MMTPWGIVLQLVMMTPWGIVLQLVMMTPWGIVLQLVMMTPWGIVNRFVEMLMFFQYFNIFSIKCLVSFSFKSLKAGKGSRN